MYSKARLTNKVGLDLADQSIQVLAYMAGTYAPPAVQEPITTEI